MKDLKNQIGIYHCTDCNQTARVKKQANSEKTLFKICGCGTQRSSNEDVTKMWLEKIKNNEQSRDSQSNNEQIDKSEISKNEIKKFKNETAENEDNTEKNEQKDWEPEQSLKNTTEAISDEDEKFRSKNISIEIGLSLLAVGLIAMGVSSANIKTI